MPIHTVWDNPEKTVIRYVVENQWSLGEMMTARKNAMQMLQEVEQAQVIGLIVDMTNSSLMPQGNMLKYFGKRSYTQIPGMKVLAFVGAGHFVETMATMFTRIYGQSAFEWVFSSDLTVARRKINRIISPQPQTE